LWHGQVQRTLDLIGETLEKLGRSRLGLTDAYAARLKRVLQDLETYVSGRSDYHQLRGGTAICRTDLDSDHGKRRSTVQRRMSAKQQMRWSPRGAHLMLKVRTAVMNATFERDHVAAERWANRPYRCAA
jgi:hypothetical protein